MVGGNFFPQNFMAFYYSLPSTAGAESSQKFYATENKNEEFLMQTSSCGDWAKVSVWDSQATGKGPLNLEEVLHLEEQIFSYCFSIDLSPNIVLFSRNWSVLQLTLKIHGNRASIFLKNVPIKNFPIVF